MDEGLHIGISREDYIRNKSVLLESQAELIRLLEKLKILRQIREQKLLISRMLVAAFKELSPELNRLTRELPKVRIEITKVREEISREDAAVNVPSVSLESELRDIQAKLEKLNALN